MSLTTGSLIDFTWPLGPGAMYGRDEGQAKDHWITGHSGSEVNCRALYSFGLAAE